LTVVRTVHRSERTSIEYAAADSIPAIVLNTAIGRRHSLPFVSHKKRGYHSHALGEQNPLKKQKSGVLPPLSCVGSLFEFKRSVFGFFRLYSVYTVDAVFVGDDYQFSHD
jgi:hypothetical protein